MRMVRAGYRPKQSAATRLASVCVEAVSCQSAVMELERQFSDQVKGPSIERDSYIADKQGDGDTAQLDLRQAKSLSAN